jgi:hypothetical protein
MDGYLAMTRSVALLACLLVASMSGAQADPSGQVPAPPTGYGIVGDAAVAAYPSAALAARTPGQAIVTCKRDAIGKPHDCRTTSETPVGQGFGAAAMKLMSEAPPQGDMQPGQRLPLPFRFVFRPNPPTITPDLFHPAQLTPYIEHAPTAEESSRVVKGMPLSRASAVKIDCWIGVTGLLTDCKLLSETPPGTGMGALELKLLPLDRFALFTAEGFPATGIKITIDTSQTTERAP